MLIHKTLFELAMMVAFGFSWPFAIVRTLRTKNVKGLSAMSYSLIVAGYICGIIYKIFYNMDYVVYFYAVNALMVSFQIFLIFYYKNKKV